MRDEQIKEIADAVLYEGYMLYPYRHSSIKNRQRWTFGVVYPRQYSERQGPHDPWYMRTQCLLQGQEQADVRLDVTVRFLHLLRCTATPRAMDEGASPVETLFDQTWEEGQEREVTVQALSLAELAGQGRRVDIFFPARSVEEEAASTRPVVRRQFALVGTLFINATALGERLWQVSVRIENNTSLSDVKNRSNVLLHSFVSTHTLLHVRQGTFISLLEPPDGLEAQAQACQNEHTWPVLIGDDGQRDSMLSSPIILYDYPRIAPESMGALFDGTEIDEILLLRIMTLTDEEKEQMRQSDPRVNALLERTESLSSEQFMQLHGVIRDLHALDEPGASR